MTRKAIALSSPNKISPPPMCVHRITPGLYRNKTKGNNEVNRGASAPFHKRASRAECQSPPAPVQNQYFKMNINDSLLSKSEVMKRLGIGEKALRRLIREGRLRVVKFGKTSPLKFRQLDLARGIAEEAS